MKQKITFITALRRRGYAKRSLAQSDLLVILKVRMTHSHHRLHHYSRNRRETSNVVCPPPAGSPARTSCPATAAPTPGSSRTSASSARRSLPAAITCPSTSKSTAFREAAGRAALQTDCRELPTHRPGGRRRRQREWEGLWKETAWHCWREKKKRRNFQKKKKARLKKGPAIRTSTVLW